MTDEQIIELIGKAVNGDVAAAAKIFDARYEKRGKITVPRDFDLSKLTPEDHEKMKEIAAKARENQEPS